jgi:hypothetical protein
MRFQFSLHAVIVVLTAAAVCLWPMTTAILFWFVSGVAVIRWLRGLRKSENLISD